MDFKERASALVKQMTKDEKVSQMLHMTPAIPRLGIPAYSWWNECLHGITRAGTATMFPQVIGLAATFDDALVQKVADVISTEARAKHHESLRKDDRGIYKGLTFWSPNINIFRDPRWGRGQETFGEDPYLTSRMGVAFVKGMQGNDPKYLKIAAAAKHFAAHSGPEKGRGGFNSIVSEKDLRETYLPAFKACVKEGNVEAIMGAYNRLNGEPCVASPTLLTKILREEWGFEGHVVSDCGAIGGIHGPHGVTKSGPESAALASNNGCDLVCGRNVGDFMVAAQEGLISDDGLDRVVTRLFTTRMKLGMFDPPEEVPYASIPYEVNDCDEHRMFASEVSKKTMVLLKNENRLLPLDRDKIKTIAVIGPNADSRDALTGNYHSTPSQYYTILDGVQRAVHPGTRVFYAQGCHLYKEKTEGTAIIDNRVTEAVSAAERADAVILCMGLDYTLEGEEGDTFNEYSSGDKMHLNLPGRQQNLVETVCAAAAGKPVILVLMSGSALGVNWADENVPAIIEAWYPGAEGGDAVASLIFGDYSPSGRLPVTFYRSVEELPEFENYSMENRTYRYMANEALYPFGYGLSYTEFEYGEISLSSARVTISDTLECSTTVKNIGKFDSDEIIQIYIADLEASVQIPKWSLCGAKRVHLKSGAAAEVKFTLTQKTFSIIDDEGKRILEPGRFLVYIGGSQPDSRSEKLTGHWVRSAEFELTGDRTEIEY